MTPQTAGSARLEWPDRLFSSPGPSGASHPEPPDRRPGAPARLVLSGNWQLAHLEALDARLETALGKRGFGPSRDEAHGPSGGSSISPSLNANTPPPAARAIRLVIEGGGLSALDTAATLLVLDHLDRRGLDTQAIGLEGFSPRHARIAQLVLSRAPLALAPTTRHTTLGRSGRHQDFRNPVERLSRPVAGLGAQAGRVAELLAGHVNFLGRVLAGLAQVILRPSRLRANETFAQLAHAGLGALPVVILVTALLGLVFAYLLGLQAEKYGANIFVVDGVALGMTREFSPVLVAILVAGRSGAAYTAQLGTMKLTEEIDAIRTLGLEPDQVLIIPRVLALVISLPLLVFVGNVASLSGAMLMAAYTLDITPTTFIERLRDALDSRHYLIGLAKAPVFALIIAVIGCRMGLAASRDTRSVGLNTTATVVQCIIAVIVVDAIFAIVLQELGL